MDGISERLNGVSLRSDSRPFNYWFIVALSKKMVHIYKFYPKSESNSEERLELSWEESGILKSFVSNRGNLVCVLRESSSVLELLDVETRNVVAKVAVPSDSSVKNVVFSPLDTHLIVLTNWAEDNANNLKVYNLTGEGCQDVLSLPYEKSYVVSRFPTWTLDESYCILRVGNDIKVWKDNNFSEPFETLTVTLSAAASQNNHAEGTSVPLPSGSIISLSPPNEKGVCYIGIFASNFGKFGRGVLKVYSISKLQKPIFAKEFDEAEEGELFWNNKGTNLLFRTFTNAVKGISSYYGANSLYLINLSNGKHKTISTVSEGIIHDISWSLTKNEFLILKGPMPAEIDLYDGNTGLKTLSFGKNNRNTVKRDPFDRLVLMGGFGNLRGEIDIWDMKTKRKIAQSKSDCSVTCEFSPDGRYFVTATTVPRMRVDCCFKIFTHGGKLIKKVDFGELYHVHVRASQFKYTQRDPSPSVTLENTVTTTALYRPPGSNPNLKIIKQTNIPTNTAVPVVNKPKLAGPPGADAALLLAASKIKKKNKKKN
ncbi:uncharacterized protein TOT_010000636 [Theileria orientalis strain Shintoku]|uniref:Eukaryotic translation initiation factor 2A n=1 Tax=Theileria orientalis strain Shintoku TaxID=869250 RepID=J4D5U0_THEOR|nr:uncharacterized protein TOT_010000636 [Theileria orientalis strain Shintoku]BAM39175.1 uncharacterized protein TOT_010000636 [Theileria orientalis strain Shintoku]|eukprot:XP_009689476.1 uncharacterized protein TOT_010000636 [Theileria orientalis strain Shintoku]